MPQAPQALERSAAQPTSPDRKAGAAKGAIEEGVVVSVEVAKRQEHGVRGPGGALEVGPGLGKLRCRGGEGSQEAGRRKRHPPVVWGTLQANASALDALVCPDFTQVLHDDSIVSNY